MKHAWNTNQPIDGDNTQTPNMPYGKACALCCAKTFALICGATRAGALESAAASAGHGAEGGAGCRYASGGEVTTTQPESQCQSSLRGRKQRPNPTVPTTLKLRGLTVAIWRPGIDRQDRTVRARQVLDSFRKPVPTARFPCDRNCRTGDDRRRYIDERNHRDGSRNGQDPRVN